MGLDPAWLNAIVRWPDRREFEVTGLRTSHGATRLRLQQLSNSRVCWKLLQEFQQKAKLVRLAEPPALRVVAGAAD